MRKIRNQVAVGARRVPMVARRKRTSDPSSTLRRPKRSEIGPMTICSAAESAR
jgi:hypothetical protein